MARLSDWLAKQVAAAIAAEPRIFVAGDLATAAPTARLAEDLGLDSVGRLYLVMVLEESFGLPGDDAEEAAERIVTWGEVLALVEAHGHAP